jgi:hypothetical protein
MHRNCYEELHFYTTKHWLSTDLFFFSTMHHPLQFVDITFQLSHFHFSIVNPVAIVNSFNTLTNNTIKIVLS